MENVTDAWKGFGRFSNGTELASILAVFLLGVRERNENVHESLPMNIHSNIIPTNPK